ncbi:AfsR/SARP family transcriptional regulator [Streptomyces flavofungini]|uniref:Winged helix-turn-helix domain-containing protein n=1 Tax=Streptomyces flavofungini TaxID=68200 RepID=A0ABS0XDN2_9ACTN|nr:BTAD domain-containing putative transcriptional regulator [Streptomyces flavofungini]MBJ3811269.1 winged helix-turn-helix domain-containing protein [Streptomyces flavofungini]
MRYRVLGVTRALRPDGTTVPVGGARLRALLAALALRPGRTVPPSFLIDRVWGDAPPADATGALQALVGRLRRALGADAIASADGGYHLCAAPDDVDAHRFERLVGEGTRALADGDATKAAALLDDALDLWHGDAFTDLPDHTAEATRWSGRRLDALRARFTAALALGRAESALPELTALCDGHPLDEPLQALRLRALRDVGRGAEALAAYQGVRRTLADGLGAEPGPELRSLYEELLRPGGAAGSGAGSASGAGVSGARGGAGAATAGPGGGGVPVDGIAGPTALPRAVTAPTGGGRGVATGTGGGSGSGGGTGVGAGADAGRGVGGDSGRGVGGDGSSAGGGGGAGSGLHSGTGAGAGVGSGRGAGSAGAWAGADGGTRSGSYPNPGAGTAPDADPARPTGTGDTAISLGTCAGPNPGAGPSLSTGSGAGPSLSADPDIAPAPDRDPAVATAPATAPPAHRPPAPGNLRARLTSFVGRSGDIDAIRGDLARARLVTLVGPGGAGKTRLSQEAAEAVGDASPDGVWLAELAPVEGPDDVPEAVLTALGARETVLRGAGAEELRAASERHADDPMVRLAEHCGPLRMLLVLDNCEHVIDAAARLAERLLAECPGLTVLATSREPLGVPGELVRPVGPLPEPFALRLLADRGASARPGFRIDDDVRAAAEICHRLDGLPLAIELAAARLRMLTPRQIADRLDDRFRLLTSGARTVLPRQQTLRAVVDWSWELLDGAERAVLRRLSVFAGGCDLAAAEAVCATPPDAGGGAGATGGAEATGGAGATGHAGATGSASGPRTGPGQGPVHPHDIPGILGSLVDKSLVVAAPAAHDDVMRYRLLETVSEYAAERLDEAGERDGVTRAHLTYFREFARVTDPALRRRGQREAIAAFETEYENLRSALRHAVAARDEQEALCLVLSLSWFWLIRDLRQEARNWSREVMALGPDPFAGPLTPAVPLYEHCTDTPPPLTGELLQEARRGVHLIQLSCMDMEPTGWQTPAAERKLRAIRDTYHPGLPQTCRNPGNLWFFAVLITGDVDRLRQVIDGTVDACREFGLTWELASALKQRANILANRADWAGDAVQDADEALEICTRLGDSFGAAEALSSRGEAHERRGEYLLAADDFQAAMDHAREVGARGQVALLTARLGAVLIETGQEERGEQLLRQFTDDKNSRLNGALPVARLFLVGLLGRTGRVAEAREQLVRLRDEFAVFGYGLFEGFLLGSHAWLDAVDGQYERALRSALRAVEQAAEPLAQMVAPQLLCLHLATAARALAAHDPGRAAAAARLLAVSDAHLPACHVPVSLEREIRGAAELAVRAVLGDADYAVAYAEGDGLSWEQAVASAGL